MQLVIHTSRVFSIPSFMGEGACQALMDLAESSGFAAAEVRTVNGQKSMPTIRNNERTVVTNPAWRDQLWNKLAQITLPTIDAQQAMGLPRELRFYKYCAGQRFKMHKDGPWVEEGKTSKLTFLLYLNDEFEGGETDFREFQITPKKGSALLFVHDTWHEGRAVVSGTKYVLRSDVLYGPVVTS
jgi:predicted 2-oxoglutarate/Fe(II)-dependent dioxygenase YbiX